MYLLTDGSTSHRERLARTLQELWVDSTTQGEQAMAHDTPKLTDHDVLAHARARLRDHLPLHAEGSVCTTEDLLNVLLGVAVNRGTIEALCADWLGTPNPETIRHYLNAQLRPEDLPLLEERLNAALADDIPTRVWTAARDVAIDLHDRPYYGTTPQAQGLWVRGEAKAGTTYFYRLATAYVMLNGLRVTVAFRFVRPEDDMVRVLDHLLQRIARLGLRLKRLFLDKGFAGTPVLVYLSARRQPAIIACPIRGKQGGTRALCHGQSSYRMRYTFNAGSPEAFPAELAVCRVMTTAQRTQRMERRASWLVFILIELDLPPKRVRRLYRRRFGIESSYRCAGRVRGWTTSRNPAYRFVLLGLSFVLVNVWVHLRWCFTQVPRRGARWLLIQHFALTRFANFVRRALERHYGYVHEIAAPASPRL
jgi:Transposase DDE domain